MTGREPTEWLDIRVNGADNETLPRLLLVGDSIARSYFDRVAKETAGRFLCARLASSASVCGGAVVEELRGLLNRYRFAVIHFNNGLHGWGYGEAEYAKGLRATLEFIARRCPRSRLIWASSTPVRRPRRVVMLDPLTERVRARNRIGLGLARERGLPVNDLFAGVIDRPGLYGEDGTHFNPRGCNCLGRLVARAVEGAGS